MDLGVGASTNLVNARLAMTIAATSSPPLSPKLANDDEEVCIDTTESLFLSSSSSFKSIIFVECTESRLYQDESGLVWFKLRVDEVVSYSLRMLPPGMDRNAEPSLMRAVFVIVCLEGDVIMSLGSAFGNAEFDGGNIEEKQLGRGSSKRRGLLLLPPVSCRLVVLCMIRSEALVAWVCSVTDEFVVARIIVETSMINGLAVL
jgi:hypothetical protein